MYLEIKCPLLNDGCIEQGKLENICNRIKMKREFITICCMQFKLFQSPFIADEEGGQRRNTAWSKPTVYGSLSHKSSSSPGSRRARAGGGHTEAVPRPGM